MTSERLARRVFVVGADFAGLTAVTANTGR
jgi:hypothetical protein